MAQTPDGYLWLGTEFGVLRFDGVRFLQWQPPAGERLPPGNVRAVLAARDGRLWIGTDGGLASWNNGKLTVYPEFSGSGGLFLYADREGTLWASSGYAPARLCAIQSSAVHCQSDAARFGQSLYPIYEDRQRNLWLGTSAGLWQWNASPAKLIQLAERPTGIAEDQDGRLLIATAKGLKQLANGKVIPYPLPGGGSQYSLGPLLRDRDGGVWIGTRNHGLLHAHHGRVDVFSESEGLSGDFVSGLFEDREGNVWVATTQGLDLFRALAVERVSVRQGLSYETSGSVLAAKDGSVWIASRGLNRWKDGRFTLYGKQSGLPEDLSEALFQDDRGRLWASTLGGVAFFEEGHFQDLDGAPVGSDLWFLAEDRPGSLWISRMRGFVHLVNGKVVEEIPWAKLGRKGPAIAVLPDMPRNGLWLGFADGGVSYFRDGRAGPLYGAGDGLGTGIVSHLRMDRDGAIWAATQGGLSRLQDGHIETLTSRNGLPCDTVHWTLQDDQHSIWLYTICGLVRIGESQLQAWVHEPLRTVGAAVFDESDGVRTEAITNFYSPLVTKSADGRIWFVSNDGVSVIDPAHLPINKLPPPVHIESVIADDKPYSLKPGMRLPAKVRTLRIEFTALSLVAPEKIHFKYQLEGQNRNWHEVINERHADYTNLPPRTYRFRVMASNNSGVWNETGDTLEFSIAPAWNQTSWFYASCVAAFLAMLWGLYRLRLLQISREFNAQLEGRVDERLRVARDLHDTLLQSFQGMLPFLQAARNKFAKGGDGLETLDQALGLGAQAIAEGREAIQGMRSSTTITNDLARAIQAVGDELKSEGSAEFRVLIEGSSRDLHPILRDEVYGIAREAIRNAFRHAEAKAIEAEIAYRDDLRVRIRDDGKGIDPEIAKEGRSGHYGMPGMRERAGRIGGKLTVWSAPGAGTEIELRVPGSKAFSKSGTRSLVALFRRGNGERKSAAAGDRHGE